MIEIIMCPDCLIEIQSTKLQNHMLKCQSRHNTSNQKSNQQILQSLKSISINLDINHIKQYIHIPKFSQLLLIQIQKLFASMQVNYIKTFNIILNDKNKIQPHIDLLTNKQLNEEIKEQLKYQIQQIINNYRGVSFNIDPSYQQSVYHLQQQYNLSLDKNKIFMIGKKDQITNKLIKFCQALLMLNKISQKICLQSQILQFQQQREKQIEQIIKSIHIFIINTDQINIKIKNIDKKCLIFISGHKESVNICKSYLLQSLQSNQTDNISKSYKISEQQLKIITKQKILQKYKQQYGIKSQIKNFTICKTAKINPRNRIYLLANSSILAIPKSAVLILPQNYMKQMKEMQQTVQFLKDYILFSPQENGKVQDSVKEFISFYVEDQGQIGVVLPEKNRQEFMQKMVQILNVSVKRIKLYILQRTQQRKAIQALQNCMLNQKKWYVVINDKKVYFPQAINQTIQESIGQQRCRIVVNQDQLGIKKITHNYDFQLGQITHIKTNIQNFVQDQGQYLILFLFEETYIIKKPSRKTKQLTCAIFELDLLNKIQRNLITEKTYKIDYQMVKKNNKSSLQGQKVQLSLVLKYPDQTTINEIWKQIKKTLIKNKIMKNFNVEDLKQQKLQEIQNWCKLNKIQITYVPKDKSIDASSYSQYAMDNLQKLIQIHKKRRLAGPLQYPTYWVPDQAQQIQLFVVNKQSKQFQQIQRKFAISKIKKLERVQNKILFEKYSLQKQFLTEQNGAPIREVMMYHGTRANAPQLIYNDRQQSFNINYANMGSYGKGIYFAKASSYSNTYCYQEGGIKKMFYCLVLAGSSQIYNGKQTHNTSYRDAAKKLRYQSVVNGVNEDIMVVFKNRRAYPLYLISY